jgi:hypothetical protein
MNKRLKLTIGLSLFLLLTGGCATQETPIPITLGSATPTATFTVTPSTTPTPLPSTTPTLTSTPLPPTATVAPITSQNDRVFQSSQGDTLPATPAPAPHAGGLSIPCAVRVDDLNLREGPGPNFSPITHLVSGTTVSALKCSPGADWLLVESSQQQIGWASAALLDCQGDLTSLPLAEGLTGLGPPAPSKPSPTPRPAAPLATPSPEPPAPLPTLTTDAWRAEYFDNPSLLGEPVLVRQDPTLDFNWYLDSPAPGIPADNFSVRWSRLVTFGEDGDYQFFASVDDGVRLYVDGIQVIGDWVDNGKADYFGYFTGLKAGTHTIVVEYFESGGFASIKVWSQKASLLEDRWRAEYFSNPDWRDPATLVREEAEIDFDWGRDAPVSGLPEDDFSVRWKRRTFLEAGNYRFYAEIADRDRVKIYLDDFLLADDNEDNGIVEGYFGQVGAGFHTLTVEYRDEGGEAEIKFWWQRE